jgi:Flp pilus assembly pilin Flp
MSPTSHRTTDPTPEAPRRATARRVGERGSSLIEYCLLLALISIVTIGAVTAFGSARDSMFERSASSMFGP